MGLLFNIRKKLAEREIEHAKVQAEHSKTRADQEIELRDLKRQAEKEKSAGLTGQEKRILKKHEDEAVAARQRRAEIFNKAKENFIYNTTTAGKFIGRKAAEGYKALQKSQRTPRVKTRVVYVDRATGSRSTYKPSASRRTRARRKRSSGSTSIFGM